jgi:hypothetical protein
LLQSADEIGHRAIIARRSALRVLQCTKKVRQAARQRWDRAV